MTNLKDELRAAARPFPKKLRNDATEYAKGRQQAGASISQIARELGLSPTGVRHWLEGRPSKKRTLRRQRPGAKLRALEVVSDAPSKKRTYTASLRGGVEVRDLALSEVIELAKALS